MNVNKVELRSQIQIKEESALKCMEFATEYMLKKAEYRLLNPLHSDSLKRDQVQQHSQLMAELDSYSFVKPQTTSMKKTKINNTIKKSQQNSLLIFNSPQISKSPQNSKTKTPQSHPKVLDKPIEKQEVLNKKQLDFSSDEEVKSSTSSKKNKSKFEKVIPPKKSNFKSEQFPGQQLGFKKKTTPSVELKPFSQSPIIKPTLSGSDSEDSFQNFPLTEPKKQKQPVKNEQRISLSLNTSDFDSYHSSILSDVKKMQIEVVSQHPSEYDISYMSDARQKQPQKHQSLLIPILQISSKQGFKKTNLFPSNQHLTHSSLNHQATEPINNNIQSGDPAPSPQQVSDYLMRLQSFEVQQQMLMKKLAKVWSKESTCIKKIKHIKWEDLKLPKPSFRFQTHLYAQVIQ